MTNSMSVGILILRDERKVSSFGQIEALPAKGETEMVLESKTGRLSVKKPSKTKEPLNLGGSRPHTKGTKEVPCKASNNSALELNLLTARLDGFQTLVKETRSRSWTTRWILSGNTSSIDLRINLDKLKVGLNVVRNWLEEIRARSTMFRAISSNGTLAIKDTP